MKPLTSPLLLALLSLSHTNAEEPHSQHVLSPAKALSHNPSRSYRTFSVRHVFHHNTAAYDYALSFADLDHASVPDRERSLSFNTATHNISTWVPWRDNPSVQQNFLEWLSRHPHDASPLSPVKFDYSQRPLVPNIADPATVRNLGFMASDAYLDDASRNKDWKPVPGWDVSNRFGWESDGVRGYVFADEHAEIVVLSFRGLSPTFPTGGTSARDKSNDNVMFSCCAGKTTWTGYITYDCAAANPPNTCREDCIQYHTNFADSYYNLAQTLYLAIRQYYAASTIWVTGHSHGGALASLIALTNGIPSISFSTPASLLFAHRLGLLPGGFGPATERPAFPDYTSFLATLQIYHILIESDPIPAGECTSFFSQCRRNGYILETHCQLGRVCTIEDPGGRQDVAQHSTGAMLARLERMESVPTCGVQEHCLDCPQWDFITS
ncbi:Alpha/Beta hydrolase protein [Cladochytrium replicatum]|nr:Alpha/Beta hydrolase protein [Cladochytrium replicatum]